MTADLDALSREIAATSAAWMLPGVRMLLGGQRPARVVVRHRIFVEDTYRDLLYTPLPGDVPDLADPVTVNSLLGGTGKIAFIMEWIALIDKQCVTSDDRTTAIARAWIAAHRGEK